MQSLAIASNTHRSRFEWSKVPLVTAYFWIIKLLTTAMGEAASDTLLHRVEPVPAVGLGAAGLLIALVLQLRADRYVAWTYWLLVAMVSVFGTMAADVLHKLGLSHLAATLLYAMLLALVFVLWYRSERTLAMHSIHTLRRECFYWAVVFTSFAFGTAAGDMTAGTLDLGNLGSGFLFLALFAAPAIGFRYFHMGGIFAFWFAYVMTRPLGASFADWVGKPHHKGGLGVGTLPVAITLTVLIVLFVAYLTVTRRDVEEAAPDADESAAAVGEEDAVSS
jgi:uncharacterized membrane-anchored protein